MLATWVCCCSVIFILNMLETLHMFMRGRVWRGCRFRHLNTCIYMQGQDSVAEAQTSSVLQEVTGYPRSWDGWVFQRSCWRPVPFWNGSWVLDRVLWDLSSGSTCLQVTESHLSMWAMCLNSVYRESLAPKGYSFKLFFLDSGIYSRRVSYVLSGSTTGHILDTFEHLRWH